MLARAQSKLVGGPSPVCCGHASRCVRAPLAACRDPRLRATHQQHASCMCRAHLSWPYAYLLAGAVACACRGTVGTVHFQRRALIEDEVCIWWADRAREWHGLSPMHGAAWAGAQQPKVAITPHSTWPACQHSCWHGACRPAACPCMPLPLPMHGLAHAFPRPALRCRIARRQWLG